MASSWEEYFEEAKTLAMPLPPRLAANLYELYAYLVEQRVKRIPDVTHSEEWRQVATTFRRLQAQAESSPSEVDVPCLLLNPKYDVVLEDYYETRLDELPGEWR